MVELTDFPGAGWVNVSSGVSVHSQCLDAGVPGHLYQHLGGLVTIVLTAFLITGFPEDVALCEDVYFFIYPVVPNVLVYPRHLWALEILDQGGPT